MPAERAARGFAARAAASRPFAAFLRLLERLDQRRDVLPVLLYHRVADLREDAHLDPALRSATPAQFAQQVEFLAAHRTVLSLEELLRIREGRLPLPPKPVLVTFDDGYRDFGEHAWPVLRRQGVPVVLFVPTGFPDRARAFWWDRIHEAVTRTPRRDVLRTAAGPLPLRTGEERRAAVRALRAHIRAAPHDEAMATVEAVAAELDAPTPSTAVLGWEALRRLAREGVSVAPHTRTHAFLDRIPREEARAEIEGAAADLERELGKAPPRAFAYPAGGHTDEVVADLRAAGYEAAFTTARGVNHLDSADWLRLRRINVGGRSSLGLIRAQLAAPDRIGARAGGGT